MRAKTRPNQQLSDARSRRAPPGLPEALLVGLAHSDPSTSKASSTSEPSTSAESWRWASPTQCVGLRPDAAANVGEAPARTAAAEVAPADDAAAEDGESDGDAGGADGGAAAKAAAGLAATAGLPKPMPAAAEAAEACAEAFDGDGAGGLAAAGGLPAALAAAAGGSGSSGASKKCKAKATTEGGARPALMHSAKAVNQLLRRDVVPGMPPFIAKGVAAKHSL